MHILLFVGDISETKEAFKDLVALFARFLAIFEAIFQKTKKLNCTNISVVLPPADLSLRFRDKVKKHPVPARFCCTYSEMLAPFPKKNRKFETAQKIWSFCHQRISGSFFRSRDGNSI